MHVERGGKEGGRKEEGRPAGRRGQRRPLRTAKPASEDRDGAEADKGGRTEPKNRGGREEGGIDARQ